MAQNGFGSETIVFKAKLAVGSVFSEHKHDATTKTDGFAQMVIRIEFRVQASNVVITGE